MNRVENIVAKEVIAHYADVSKVSACRKGTNQSLDNLQDKLEIKKDKKGMVYIQGSVIKQAINSKELFALFEEGSKNRHTASTSKLGSVY